MPHIEEIGGSILNVEVAAFGSRCLDICIFLKNLFDKKNNSLNLHCLIPIKSLSNDTFVMKCLNCKRRQSIHVEKFEGVSRLIGGLVIADTAPDFVYPLVGGIRSSALRLEYLTPPLI